MSDFFALREAAKTGRDPTLSDGALEVMLKRMREAAASRYLEIGAGEGYTAISVARETGAEVILLECDPVRAARCRENFAKFAPNARYTLHEADAADCLPLLAGPFDAILLDGPKAQYRRYFPDCKRLLRRGGFLFSDDVLLFGRERGGPPKKRKMLAEHLREYLDLLMADPAFQTEVFRFGEGFAVSHLL